jgi:hypothetical protein
MPPHTWSATGAIEHYSRQGPITLVRGQAAGAYNLPQPPSLAKLWQKLLDEPLPPMEPRVERFDRALAFIASADRPVLAVHDRVQTAGPAVFDWLLHAANSMATATDGSVKVHSGNARLAVRLLASVPFAFHQEGGFPIRPEFAANTAYVLGRDAFIDQWHLRATTQKPSDRVNYLAVLVPYRASEPEPPIETIETPLARGFRIAGAQVLTTPDLARLTVISADGTAAEAP